MPHTCNTSAAAPSRAPVHGQRRGRVTVRFQTPKQNLSIHRPKPQPEELQHQVGVLSQTENELTEFCSSDASDPAACVRVRDWYVNKVRDAEAHQALGQAVTDAEELQRLQQTVRELLASGSMSAVYTSLATMKRIEDKKATEMAEAAAANSRPGTPATLPLPESAKPAPSMGGLTPEDKELLTKLFRRMDSDGNGELTYDEFTNAMHMIGDDLHEDDQLLVGSVLDLQGHVTLDQFIAIVEEAEAHRLYQSSDAAFLRHACHVGESHHLPGAL